MFFSRFGPLSLSHMYPALYRKRFPEIAYSVLYGKDLARGKNTTVLTEIDLDGGNTFSTQGFQYVPVSDAHAVYTNDEAVIASLTDAGYPVSPFFSMLRHVDLEQCAKDSYLVYEPVLSGIYIDQTVEGFQSQNIWTNYNRLYGGSYEATFCCRLLMPEETKPDESCVFAVNQAHGGEYARYELSPADMDKDGVIMQKISFYVPVSMHGNIISFSVYGGNVRRLIVEDISCVRVA